MRETIVSASRRTDIPAFYSAWFLNRLRQGWCHVPNPFNSNQVSRVALSPREVDAFVFWSRNPRPLLRHLDEIDDLGCRYYFLFTLIGYPSCIDPGSPSLSASIETFHELSKRVGPQRVIWRYDPIVLSDVTGVRFHNENFHLAARELRGAARRCVISFVKPYRKARSRMEAAAKGSTSAVDFESPAVRGLLCAISDMARENGMEMLSCSSERDFSEFGINPSRCVDADLVSNLFGTAAGHSKDPCQRKECGCSLSRDIGMYDTCLFGCRYCYATSTPDRAKANYARHDPQGPALVSIH